MIIRPPTQADLPAISRVLADTDLFPPEMLTEMMTPYFAHAGDDTQSGERWLVVEDSAERVVGFCYFRAEPLTDATWNLLAIGLRHEAQGQGFGAALVTAVERALAHERVLIVETSSLDDFAATRQFYLGFGFEQEAVIRDYWADGDDKVIFRKSL